MRRVRDNIRVRGRGYAGASGGGGGGLLPLGSKIGLLGHSYVGGGANGGTLTSSNPTIWTNPKGSGVSLAVYNPSYRYDTWHGFDYATFALAAGTGTFAVNDTITNGSFTGLIVASSFVAASGGRVTVQNPTGTFAAGACTSSSGGSASTSGTLDIKNTKGFHAGVVGDYLTSQNGYIGILARVPDLMQWSPKIVIVDGSVNSLVNGVTYTNAVTYSKQIYDAIRGHANGANTLVFFLNCRAFTAASGFNDGPGVTRANIANYNLALATDILTWSDYGTKLFHIDAFSETITSSTNLTANCAGFAAGTQYGDSDKMYDTLHPSMMGTYYVDKLIDTTLSTKVTQGDWFATAYTGSGNAIASPNANFTGYAGAVSGTSALTAGTVTASISTTTMTVASVDSGAIYIGAKITGTGVSSNTYIVSQLSGTPLGAGTYQVNNSQTVASTTITMASGVITGLTIAGPSSSSRFLGLIIAGDGTNGAAVGKNLQRIIYTNNGASSNEIMSVNWNTVTAAPMDAGNLNWVQFYQKINFDNTSNMLTGIYNQFAVNTSQKSQGMIPEGYTTNTAQRLPAAVVTGKTLITPPYKLDGTQSANGKLSVKIVVGNLRTGTSIIDILPGGWIGIVSDPSA